MGTSWSSRRRDNYFLNPPPPPPHLPPPYYYSAESHPAPPPPPPPPPPPQGYYFTSTTPYTLQNNSYVTPPPLPPPPPQTHHCFCYTNVYSSCSNHANSMVGQFHYHPYYLNHASGWPAIHPPVGLAVPLPPYVDHQTAKKIRNDVNVHKDTLRLEVDELNPDQQLVSFVFDALYDGW